MMQAMKPNRRHLASVPAAPRSSSTARPAISLVPAYIARIPQLDNLIADPHFLVHKPPLVNRAEVSDIGNSVTELVNCSSQFAQPPFFLKVLHVIDRPEMIVLSTATAAL